MALTIGELVAYLTVNDKGFHKALDAAERGLERVGKATGGIGKAAGLAALAGQAVQLGAAIAPAAGAMLAMPAAMATTRIASATLKLGLSGLGDAMNAVAEGDAKKLDEALKDLTPAARGFVKELGTLKGKALDPIQKAVQSRLLSGLVGPLRTAAANVIPAARKGLTGMAGALNGVAKEGLRVAATPVFRRELSKVFSGTTGTVNTLKGAVGPLATILLKLVNLGQPLAQRMAGWAVSGAKAAAAFLTSKEGASKLSGVVQRAGDTLATLGRIAGNIGTGLAGIFKNAAAGPENLLTTIEKLTASFAAWAKSAQGQQQIANLFGLLSQTAKALSGVLPVLLGPLGALGALFTSLPASAQGVIGKIAAFAVVAGLLGGKLMPLISGVRLLATGIGKIGPAAKGIQAGALWLGRLGPAVAGAVTTASAAIGRFVLAAAVASGRFAMHAARMVASMALTAGRVVAGWVLMGAQAMAQAVRVAAAWVLAMGPIGWVITAVVGLVALIVANWDKIKAAIAVAWEWVKEKTAAVWGAITGALSAAWGKIKSAAAATWEWIKSAIGKAIDFITRFFMPFAIVRLIAENWDKIKAAAKTAWDWIVSKVQAAVRLVIAGVTWLKELPGKVAAWFGELTSAAIRKATELVTWIKGLPGKILAGLGKLGNLLVNAGKDIITGLWNGLQSMASWIKSKIMALVKAILPDAVEKVLGISSPSKVFMTIGEQTMRGLGEGIKKGGSGVLSAALDIARLLGGVKFGLDVHALTPTVTPKPAPKKKPAPKPRRDPNDVTYDRGPKPRRDPNDVTYDRGPKPRKKKPSRDPNDVTYDRGPKRRRDPNNVTYDRGPRKKKDDAGYVQPSTFNVTNHFHAANMSPGQVSRTMWLQAHAGGY